MIEKTKYRGFTMIEVMLVVLISSIALLATASVLADAHRGFNKMYIRVHGDIVNQAHEARVIFDRICRKSSRSYKDTSTGTDEVYVYYFSTDSNPTKATFSPMPDRFARFYTQGTDLKVDYGSLTRDVAADTVTRQDAETSITIANSVSNAIFLQPDTSTSVVQMILTLHDTELNQGLTVTCSSVRHN